MPPGSSKLGEAWIVSRELIAWVMPDCMPGVMLVHLQVQSNKLMHGDNIIHNQSKKLQLAISWCIEGFLRTQTLKPTLAAELHWTFEGSM